MSDFNTGDYANGYRDGKVDAEATITALRAEVERLRAALGKINVGEGWAALIARAVLKEPRE